MDNPLQKISSDIKNYPLRFDLTEKGPSMLVHISRKDGVWRCEVIEGDSGAGVMTGGKYTTLAEYESEVKQHHRYCFSFYNKQAKVSDEIQTRLGRMRT